MPCSTDRRFNTDSWYCYSYQSITLRAGEKWCISSTTSANSVFKCSITEATLVSKRKRQISEIRQISIALWQEKKTIIAKGRIKGHLEDKYWQQVRGNWFSASLRAMKKPGLFGFIGSSKSAQIMYDLKGKRGPEHDPLPSVATT